MGSVVQVCSKFCTLSSNVFAFFENQLGFDKVTESLKVGTLFFETQCSNEYRITAADLEVMKLIFAVLLCVTRRQALHVVKKNSFFTMRLHVMQLGLRRI